MTWGFSGIEIAAGSGPLKLLKRRKRKGGSKHTPHLPTPPHPSRDPASDRGDPSSGEKALSLASKKQLESKIPRLTVVPSPTFGLGLERLLLKPHPPSWSRRRGLGQREAEVMNLPC